MAWKRNFIQVNKKITVRLPRREGGRTKISSFNVYHQALNTEAHSGVDSRGISSTKNPDRIYTRCFTPARDVFADHSFAELVGFLLHFYLTPGLPILGTGSLQMEWGALLREVWGVFLVNCLDFLPLPQSPDSREAGDWAHTHFSLNFRVAIPFGDCETNGRDRNPGTPGFVKYALFWIK
jgi:hypothetical protein